MLELSKAEQKEVLGGRVIYFFKAYEDGELVEEFSVDNGMDANRERARLKRLGYRVEETHLII